MKELEEQFRILFEQASEGIFVTDTTGNFIDINNAGCKMLGYSLEELKNMSVPDILLPDEIERFHACVERLLEGVGMRERVGFIRKDRSVFIGEVSSTKLSNGRLQAIIWDVTQQHREQEILLKSEERFRQTLDHLLEGCMIVGFDWTYLYLNDAINKGNYQIEDLLGRSMLEMYPGVEKTKLFSYYKLCMEKRIPQNFEESFTFEDGSTIWNNFSVQPIPEGIFVLALDITERKKIEEKLWQNEARLKVAMSFIKFTLFNQDLNLRYTWIFRSQIGLPPEQIIGKTDKEIMASNPDSERKLTKLKRDVLESGKSARMQLEYNHAGIILYYSIFVEPLYSPDGHIIGITGSSMDITEQRYADEEMIKSREKIVQLYRHLNDVREEERASMAREIHDELGQTLASLKLDLIGIKDDFDEQIRVNRKISKAITLVDTSIKTVRKISSALRPQILDELGLASAIEWLSNDFKKRSGIKCKLDLQEIEEPGGIISISLFRIFQAALTNIMLHSRARSMDVKLALNNKLLILTVKDDGIGITQEQINSPKSFGIVGMNERAKQINGTFEIHSEMNKGTEIRVTVPLTDKTEAL